MSAPFDPCLARWCERIRAAAADRRPLRLAGGGSKDFYGQALAGERFDTREYRGLVSYAPSELVVSVRCGTPLAELETILAEKGQSLAFEPPHFGPQATVGGCVAAGLSGPRRARAGSVRDFVLGVKIVDGQGRLLNFGGQVMKNVAGYDVSRLLAGSLGTLGVIAEVSLKVMPLAPSELTLGFELAAADAPNDALRRVNRWRGEALPISASLALGQMLHVRLSGAATAVSAAARTLGGEALANADAAALWRSVREQTHPFFAGDGALWRLGLPATAALALPGAQLIEWCGAQRWQRAHTAAEGQTLRRLAADAGGHATLFRAPLAQKAAVGAFAPLAEPLQHIHRRLKAAFDPSGVFNPGRLYPDF